MRKDEINSKLNKLESDVGIKEPVIFVFNKEYDKDKRYTFEVVDGQNVYYDGETVITEDELNSRTDKVFVFDIEFVKSPYKNDNI